MDRYTTQSIALGALLTTYKPAEVEPFWRELLLLGTIGAVWIGLVVAQKKFPDWYFWRKHSHGDVLKDSLMSDAYEEAGLDPSKHDGLGGMDTVDTKQRLSTAMPIVSWVVYGGFLVAIYGVVFPQSDDVFWTVTAGGFAMTVGMTAVFLGLDRMLES